MNTPPDQFPARCRVVVGAPEFRDACREAGLGEILSLTDRSLGEGVAEHRTSWVRRCSIGSIEVFAKTYDYPTAADRRRGAFRNTFLAPSRAGREARALQWLATLGFPAPEPLLLAEWRRWGWLRRALLVTSAWPGEPLTRLAPGLDAGDKQRLGRAVGDFVRALHHAGFRDGNLDARNLLARRRADGFELTVIDSPRYRLVPPGRLDDRRARRDWARLLPQLAELGVPV